ncbi:MAG: ATP-binding cassette domain-containing protein [Gemmataceae bacterium]|nr:ATP-binding cassette domain-containing protein [Gemmataceae bacterium]
MAATPSLIQFGTNAAVAFGDKVVVVVGRSRDVDLPVYDPACSRRQFLVRRAGEQFVLEPLSENSPTFCDGVRATAATPIREATVIEAGASRFRLVGAAAVNAPPSQRPLDHHAGRATVVGTVPLDAPSRGTTAIRLREEIILGRDESLATDALPHPLVSRRHALVRRTPTGAVVKDLGSANGTYLNGQRLGVAIGLNVGDRIQIGPYAFHFTGAALEPATGTVGPFPNAPAADLRLVAHAIDFHAGADRLLHDVSLGIRGGEFVAVLGPSGCGKSTLLKILSGANPPAAGRVLFDGCDLYAAPAGATRRIAVVPQREILPTVLTVTDALRLTASLRLPPDTTRAERDARVDWALGVVGLAERRNLRIAALSGGQLKRVGLANELLAEPGLVLLDEVTSGLDEQADREMMGLFRQLANGGRAVVAVTHSLAHVAEYCHQVVVLTKGGRLAFSGRPDELAPYFGIDRMGDIYERLNDRTPDEWANQWDASGRVRLPAAPPVPLAATVSESADTADTIRHQTPLLVERTARVLIADRLALTVTFGQPLLIALLLAWVFGDVRDPANPAAAAAAARSVLFVLAVTAFWLGCNTAAKEIVREWALFSKERQSHLAPAAYLLAKASTLAVVTLLQVAILFGIVSEGCHLGGNGTSMAIVLGLVGLAGVSAGLLVSAVASSEAVAVAMVPVIVIPQIVMTDVFRPLTGAAKVFADAAISTHRGFDGLLTALPPDLAAVAATPGATVRAAAFWLMVQSIAFALVTWRVLDRRGRPIGASVQIPIRGGTR